MGSNGREDMFAHVFCFNTTKKLVLFGVCYATLDRSLKDNEQLSMLTKSVNETVKIIASVGSMLKGSPETIIPNPVPNTAGAQFEGEPKGITNI